VCSQPSRVYLNYAAGQPGTRELDGKLTGALFALAGCAPTALDAAAAYCHTFDTGPDKAAVL